MEISSQKRLRLIRQTLSEVPPPSNYTPVSDAIERSQTLDEKGITSTLAGLSSLPQSTAVFANPTNPKVEIPAAASFLALKEGSSIVYLGDWFI